MDNDDFVLFSPPNKKLTKRRLSSSAEDVSKSEGSCGQHVVADAAHSSFTTTLEQKTISQRRIVRRKKNTRYTFTPRATRTSYYQETPMSPPFGSVDWIEHELSNSISRIYGQLVAFAKLFYDASPLPEKCTTPHRFAPPPKAVFDDIAGAATVTVAVPNEGQSAGGVDTHEPALPWDMHPHPPPPALALPSPTWHDPLLAPLRYLCAVTACVVVVFFILAIASVPRAQALPPPALSQTLMTEYPFVASHNAGTGYLPSSLINRWAATQDGGVTAQLECGARALTLHASMERGQLLMRHGPTLVRTAFADAVAEAVEWAAANPEEIVILYVNKCTGTQCESKVREVTSAHGIAWVERPLCFGERTTQEVWRQHRLEGGGSVVAVDHRCVDENYIAAVECHGREAGAGVNDRDLSAALFAVRNVTMQTLSSGVTSVGRGVGRLARSVGGWLGSVFAAPSPHHDGSDFTDDSRGGESAGDEEEGEVGKENMLEDYSTHGGREKDSVRVRGEDVYRPPGWLRPAAHVSAQERHREQHLPIDRSAAPGGVSDWDGSSHSGSSQPGGALASDNGASHDEARHAYRRDSGQGSMRMGGGHIQAYGGLGLSVADVQLALVQRAVNAAAARTVGSATTHTQQPLHDNRSEGGVRETVGVHLRPTEEDGGHDESTRAEAATAAAAEWVRVRVLTALSAVGARAVEQINALDAAMREGDVCAGACVKEMKRVRKRAVAEIERLVEEAGDNASRLCEGTASQVDAKYHCIDVGSHTTYEAEDDEQSSLGGRAQAPEDDVVELTIDVEDVTSLAQHSQAAPLTEHRGLPEATDAYVRVRVLVRGLGAQAEAIEGIARGGEDDMVSVAEAEEETKRRSTEIRDNKHGMGWAEITSAGSSVSHGEAGRSAARSLLARVRAQHRTLREKQAQDSPRAENVFPKLLVPDRLGVSLLSRIRAQNRVLRHDRDGDSESRVAEAPETTTHDHSHHMQAEPTRRLRTGSSAAWRALDELERAVRVIGAGRDSDLEDLIVTHTVGGDRAHGGWRADAHGEELDGRDGETAAGKPAGPRLLLPLTTPGLGSSAVATDDYAYTVRLSHVQDGHEQDISQRVLSDRCLNDDNNSNECVDTLPGVRLFRVQSEGDRVFNCWSANSASPWRRMNAYLAGVLSKARTPGRLWLLQAHWQYSVESVVLGTLAQSSVVLDQRRSRLNREIALRVRRGLYTHGNLVEVDDVCDSGGELLQALRERQGP